MTKTIVSVRKGSSAGGGAATATLLTGATGFLGTRLLAGLCEEGQPVYALVRARDDEAAAARLRDALRRARLPAPPRGVLTTLAGDLRSEGLGLTRAGYDRLARGVGRIFHCGALVNASLPYAELRATNVDGLSNVLRLCQAGDPKRLHLISSTAAAPGLERAKSAAGISDPYARSKAAAEELCEEAAAGGLDVIVHRLGALAGDSRSGVCNERDQRWMILRATLALGASPLLPSSFGWLPVDDAAAAVLAAARAPRPPALLRFSAPRLVPWLEVFSWLRLHGYRRLAVTDPVLWRERVAGLEDPELAALALAPLATGALAEPPAPAEDVDCGGGARLRSLNRSLLGLYLDEAARSGSIPAPPA